MVSRYQKGKTNLDFTEARDSEWQWHQLGHMQVSTLLTWVVPEKRAVKRVCVCVCYCFLTPVLNSQGMKKLCYAIQTSTKIKLELTLLLLLLTIIVTIIIGNVSVTEMMLNRDPKDEMMKAFKLFDDDDSGKISLRNLKRVAR